MWRGGIFPEVEEQFGTSRIMGSSHLRTGEISGDIPTNPSVPKEPGNKGRKKNKKIKNDRTHTGGRGNVHVLQHDEDPLKPPPPPPPPPLPLTQWESDCDLVSLALPNSIVLATLGRERPSDGILIPILGAAIPETTVRSGYIGV